MKKAYMNYRGPPSETIHILGIPEGEERENNS